MRSLMPGDPGIKPARPMSRPLAFSFKSGPKRQGYRPVAAKVSACFLEQEIGRFRSGPDYRALACDMPALL